MTRRILYLTPSLPTRSGIADYAERFRAAVERSSDWRLTVATLDDVQANSPGDFSRIDGRVRGWLEEHRREPFAALHAEIGYKQQAALYAILRLGTLWPDLPCCITVHDPPLVVAPALLPLSFGVEWVAVRRFLRLLDYTPLARSVVRRALLQAGQVFALSQAGTEALKCVVPSHPHVDYLPHLTYRTTAPPVRSSRQDRTLRLLFLGFWGPSKGIPTLLAAMALLARTDLPPIRLRLAGGPDAGPAGAAYARTVLSFVESSPVRPNIDLVGFVSPEDLDAELDAADVMVLPYRVAPGFSSSAVALRGASAGLPIVGTNVGILPELVNQGETGLLVTPNDAQALAGAIARLVRDRDLRWRFGEAAWRRTGALHGEQVVVAQLAAAYERLAQAYPSSSSKGPPHDS